MKLIDTAYSRRQAKYQKLLRSYFLILFDTFPEIGKIWLGPSLCEKSFPGKQVLWVDDDFVGIAHFAELLQKHCDVKSDLVGSTTEALAKSLLDYHLVISNLRRDPHDNAGIQLTESIRKTNTNIPIIIFTKPEHAQVYRAAIHKVGANEVATDEQELFRAIEKLLSPAT